MLPVAGIISAVAGGLNAIGNNIFAGLNYREQQKNLEWQKQQHALMQQREDNAVQRRVEDLKAAGLSPTLAAGSAAQAHQPIQTHAPQMGQLQQLGVAEAYLNLVRQKADIARTNAETQRVQELTKNDVQLRDLNYRDYLLREEGISLDKQRVQQDAQRIGISYAQLQHDYERVVNDQERVRHDAQRLLNERERIEIEQNHLQLANLMNQAQRGLINEQTFSEQLRQIGISYESEKRFWELKDLIYNLTLMSNLGLPTHGTLPTLQHLNIGRAEAARSAIDASNLSSGSGSRRYYQGIEHNDRRSVR